MVAVYGPFGVEGDMEELEPMLPNCLNWGDEDSMCPYEYRFEVMGLMLGEYIMRGETGGDSVANRDMFQCSLLGSGSPVREGDVWQPSCVFVCMCVCVCVCVCGMCVYVCVCVME